MLEVLKKKGLKDTAVVVTRYFGGIKLGAGGLIRAYSSTVSAAIESTGIVKRQLMKEMKITVDYKLLGKLENSLRNSDYLLKEINYLENVEFIVFVESGLEDSFSKWVIDLTSDQAAIQPGEVSYIEQNVSGK